MFRKSCLFLCLFCGSLLLYSCGTASREENLPLSYYYLPSYTVAVGTEKDGYAVLETPLTLTQHHVEMTSAVCDGPHGIVTVKLRALSEKDGEDWTQVQGFDGAVLTIGDRQSSSTKQEENILVFRFTDEEELPAPILPGDLSEKVQLILEETAYPLNLMAAQPADKMEELGTVARDGDLAVLFVPEAEGMIIKAFYDKPIEEGLRIEAQQIRWGTAIDENGKEAHWMPLAYCDYVPLSKEQRNNIAKIIVNEIEVAFYQDSGQNVSIPLEQLEAMAFMADGLEAEDGWRIKERFQEEPWQFDLFQRFPMRLNSAQRFKSGAYAGQWHIEFTNEVDHMLRLEGWYADRIEHYSSGIADNISLLGLYATEEQIKNGKMQLTFYEVRGKQFGTWVYE